MIVHSPQSIVHRTICIIISLFVVYSLWFMASPAFAEEKLIEIKAKKFSYTPHIVEVNKGDLVRIRLISEDVHHGLYLDGYDIKTFAHPGQDGHIQFIADKTGRFSFRCAVTCGEFHPYMVGYLIVNPNLSLLTFVFLTIIIGLASVSFVIFKKKEKTEDG